uniref:4-O-methyl-glucuronoyl methylesterase-like domain-containing protein n=1 Tax=uncultured firmicutes bacterium contig_31 TaxID=1643554 RepID=A0A141GND7_9FIRM|nr:hypothetical protein [uncultured firmicutes bacterium contig_31]
MGFIEEELKNRKLPELTVYQDGSDVENADGWKKRREEIKKILQESYAGYAPDFKLDVEEKLVSEDPNGYGGKVQVYTYDLRIRSPFNYTSFQYKLAVPKHADRPPVFLNFSFTPQIADGLGEEITDCGFAVANIYYEDITADKNDDYMTGAGRFCRRNPHDSWGKIAIWAWGGSRVTDRLVLRDDIDIRRIAVVGHSRLGKTALWCGAMDERFSMVAANDSGGGGAAIFRGKTGELVKDLAGTGSKLWFCGNFYRYAGRESEMPFDQHFVLALVAPRNLYISSASQDDWADPKSEFLACAAASPVYELLGYRGLVSPDRYPEENECFHEGKIGYHLRKGTHYMGRYDWHKIMEYRQKHNV